MSTCLVITSRESALDTCLLANRPAAVSPMGGGRRTTTQAPLSWGQARASGKTGARGQLGDDGRTWAPRCLPRAVVDDTLTRGPSIRHRGPRDGRDPEYARDDP